MKEEGRRGQVTMFIIVGLVFVITMIVLYLVIRASRPETNKPEVDIDTAYAQTCLQQATQVALDGLSDDGVLVQEEGAEVLSDGIPYMYVVKDKREVLDGCSDPDQPAAKESKDCVEKIRYRAPLGLQNYFGLCEKGRSPDYAWNKINTDGERKDIYNEQYNGPYSCTQIVYDYFLEKKIGAGGAPADVPSIQEELAKTITQHMQECMQHQETGPDINTTLGRAEVIIQQGAVVIRWTNAELSHTEERDLNLAWAAIAEAVSRETSDRDYRPDKDDFNCEYCDELVTFEDQEFAKTEAKPYDVWSVSVAGRFITNVSFEDRPIVFLNETNNALVELETNEYGQWNDNTVPPGFTSPVPQTLGTCDDTSPYYDSTEHSCVYTFWQGDEDKIISADITYANPPIPPSTTCTWTNPCPGHNTPPISSESMSCYPELSQLNADEENTPERQIAITRGCKDIEHKLWVSLIDEYELSTSDFLLTVEPLTHNAVQCTYYDSSTTCSDDTDCPSPYPNCDTSINNCYKEQMEDVDCG